MHIRPAAWRCRLAPPPRRIGPWIGAVILALGLNGLSAELTGGWAQEAQPVATPAASAPPLDPNLELRERLATLRAKNDSFAESLKQLQLLLSLNVCDPATKAKIEELIAAARQASNGTDGTGTLAGGGDLPAAATSVSVSPSPADLATPLSRAEIAKRLQGLTVFVLTEGGFGSGIVVGPDLVLTSRHVIESAGPRGILVLQSGQPKPLQAKLVAETASSEFNHQDFALLRLDQPVSQATLAIAPRQEPLESVYAAGFPNSVVSNDAGLISLLSGQAGQVPSPVLSSGTITTIQQNGNVPMIVHSAEISPGSSGGPLINACGQLLGINTFITDGGGGAAGKFAISAQVARDFLGQHGVTVPLGAPCAAGAN